MSVEQSLITTQTGNADLTTVRAEATAGTPAKAAQGVQDIVQGGLIGQTESALAKYPLLLIQGFGVVLLVLLAVFVYLLVCAVSFESATAQHYLVQIFTAWGVWLIVAGVIVGGAYALPQKSPFQA